MEPGQYYCVTTRRFTLQCNHEIWLLRTQELYNEVLLFYYGLFLDQEELAPGSLSEQSNQQVLRSLEILTIVGRDKQPVPCPLPWKKVPLYFRRAAINAAVACARNQLERSKKSAAKATGQRAESFHIGVTFYKGMYRDLTATHVNLKLWTGSEWKWMNCRLKGNFIPEDAVPLSPTVALEANGNALLLPVKQPVGDGRKARQRMEEDSCICCVQFTNEDSFAVAVILDGNGNQKAARFFRGGNEYVHRCREITECIERSERSMGIKDEESLNIPGGEHYNNRYWMKLKHLRNHYAHKISRQLILFCQAHQAGIIVLPKYNEQFRKCVMCKAGNWSSLHLSGRIRELISYKAWQAGIVVLEVSASKTSAFCAVCGEKVKKTGSSFECPNGHRGSRQINTARNLGIKCLVDFGRIEAGARTIKQSKNGGTE